MTRLILGHVAQLCLRRPGLVVLVAVVLSLACGAYSLNHLSFTNSRTGMLDPQARVQLGWTAFKSKFGLSADLVVLAQGPRGECEAALDELATRLRQEPENFENVFHRMDLPSLAGSALYYLSRRDLIALRQTLATVKPWIKELSKPGGLDRLLALGKTESPKVTARRLAPILHLLNLVLEQLLETLESRGKKSYQSPLGNFQPDLPMLKDRLASPGQTRFYTILPDGRTYALVCTANNSSGSFAIDLRIVARLRQIVRDVAPEYKDVTLTVSGEPALNTEEMVGAQQDALRSGKLAFVLVCILLGFSLGAVWRPLAVVFCLGLALTWSAAFAAWGIGQLNLLTINFGTVLVGLGMTFGIHTLYRYQEERVAGVSLDDSVRAALVETGGDNLVGAVTTAVAFFSLHFTTFRSAGELGLIAGTGTLLCLLAMLVVLPSLLVLLERFQGLPNKSGHPARLARLDLGLRGHPLWVLGISLWLTVYSLSWFNRVEFDYNMLHLQPRHSASVDVERFLQGIGYSALRAVSVADNMDEALRQRDEFLKLPQVAQVESVVSLLPLDLASKTTMVGEVVALAGTLHVPEILPLLDAQGLLKLQRSYQSTEGHLRLVIPHLEKGGHGKEAERLGALLTRLTRSFDPKNPGPVVDGIRRFDTDFRADLSFKIEFLRRQRVEPSHILDDLPKALSSRSLSADGQVALYVIPRADVWEREALERFVKAVESVNPDITGGPMLVYYYLEALRNAYSASARNALIVIAVLLLVHFRSFTRAGLALLPKLLGMVWMVGAMGVSGLSFNPANFMALPLTLGIGLIFGVHVMSNLLSRRDSSLFASSTGPAVWLSGLATVVGFATLLASQHRGIASFGFVMAVGVAANLVSSLVTLPALVDSMRRWGWKI